jgi:hypothetical protein
MEGSIPQDHIPDMFQHPALKGTQQALRAFQTAPAGRPVKNIRPLLLRSTDRLASGWQVLNSVPEPLKMATEKYLKTPIQLPPGLAPTRTHVRPAISEQHRAAQISKGWKRPTSRY